MRLSIIIPVFNSQEYIPRLEKTISFYFNKTDTEIVFIDDNSSDNSVHLIEALIDSNNTVNIKVLCNDINKGPSYSRNRGLKHAKGEYIAFLDADDAWHVDKIDHQIRLMEKNNVLICGTLHKVVNEARFIEARKKPVEKKCDYIEVKWPYILFKTPFATPSVVIHNSLKHYCFDERLKYAEDYHLWIRIVHDHLAIRLQYPLTYTFKHDYLLSEKASLSSDLWQMQNGIKDGFFLLFKEQDYTKLDKIWMVAGFVFSWVKFIRRLSLRIIKRVPFFI